MRKTVLVVDDEPFVRAMAVAALGEPGYYTLEAHDAAEALRISTETRADLVLSDVVMPGMSGPELVRELQRRGYRGRYLPMSGYSSGALQTADLNLPFLDKPFSMDALAGAIRSAMADGDA
jgi:CheY-like chemotaxis protein